MVTRTLEPDNLEAEAIGREDALPRRAIRPSTELTSSSAPLGGIHTSASTLRAQSRAFSALKRDQRKAKRHRYVVMGTVLRPDGRFMADMVVENISVGGLAFRSNQPFNVGDRPLLEVSINGRSHLVKVIVRRTYQSHTVRMSHGCGVEYVDPTGEIAQDVVGLTGELAAVRHGYSFADESAA